MLYIIYIPSIWMVKENYMANSSIIIQPFDTKGASDREYSELNRHTNRLRLERLPDDPPIPLTETIQNLQSMPPFVDLHMWCAWNSTHSIIVAQGNVVTLRTEDNQHLAQFEITVLPEVRRQGIASQCFGFNR